MRGARKLRSFSIASGLIPLLLGGCVFTPETVTRYDEDCRIFFKEMRLNVEELGPIGGCNSQEECASLLVVIAAVTSVSAIVSGSIVIAGNTIYWLERRGQCLAKTAEAA